MEITTLLWFSLIKFWFSQGTRCSASLASCGLRLNVIEAHVRAASQSSYYVSCHPLGRIGKQYEDKIAVALPPVPYPLEVGLRKRRAYWSDRACSPHGWPAWYLIWFISQKLIEWSRSPIHILIGTCVHLEETCVGLILSDNFILWKPGYKGESRNLS